MKLLINATALDSRGGYSIISAFLTEINSNTIYLNQNNISITVLVARTELCKYGTNEINVVYDSYPKQGTFQKWKYENILLPKLIKEQKTDVYLSLQNFGLNRINIPQFVLIHQSIPFSNLKIQEIELKNFIKYKVLLNIIYKLQLKKINGVFVQTNWMKEAIISRYKYSRQITVIRPNVEDIVINNKELEVNLLSEFNRSERKCLYVTNSEKYKNNHFLIEAVNSFNEINEKKIVLYLTLIGESTKYIRYIGKVSYDSIYTLYQSVDALVFPSLTETLGLPLLEAIQSNKIILAADLPYAKEICGNIALYFDPRNKESLMKKLTMFALNKETIIRSYNINESKGGCYMDYIENIFNISSSHKTDEVKYRLTGEI
jgi:hypothetical protein